MLFGSGKSDALLEVAESEEERGGDADAVQRSGRPVLAEDSLGHLQQPREEERDAGQADVEDGALEYSDLPHTSQRTFQRALASQTVRSAMVSRPKETSGMADRIAWTSASAEPKKTELPIDVGPAPVNAVGAAFDATTWLGAARAGETVADIALVEGDGEMCGGGWLRRCSAAHSAQRGVTDRTCRPAARE